MLKHWITGNNSIKLILPLEQILRLLHGFHCSRGFLLYLKKYMQENCYRNSLYSLPLLKKDLNKMSLLKMKSIQTITPHNAWKM